MGTPNHYASQENLNRAHSALGSALGQCATAKAYTLSAYHNESPYYVEIAIEKLADARADLDRAEALMRQYLSDLEAKEESA